jgi:hypothetical protein
MSTKPEATSAGSAKVAGVTTSREMLRHAVATVAYRGGKALRGAPERFATFEAGEKTRTPGQLLAHLGDLFDWALSMAKGKQEWHDSPVAASWEAGTQRFFAALEAFDAYLASSEPLHAPVERLLQGPIADSLTHVGQIVILRRLAGAPIRSENYFKAEIKAGCVGAEQKAPSREF